MFVLSSKGYFLAEFGQMTDVSFASIALWLYIKFLPCEDYVSLSIEHSHRCEYCGHFQLKNESLVVMKVINEGVRLKETLILWRGWISGASHT